MLTSLSGIATITIDGQAYQFGGQINYSAKPIDLPREVFDLCDHTITTTFKCIGRNNLFRLFKRLYPDSRCYVRPRSAKMRRGRRIKYWRPE